MWQRQTNKSKIGWENRGRKIEADALLRLPMKTKQITTDKNPLV